MGALKRTLRKLDVQEQSCAKHDECHAEESAFACRLVEQIARGGLGEDHRYQSQSE